VFSCSKIEQKQLNTWVSFQSAEQPLLGQFSVSGNIRRSSSPTTSRSVAVSRCFSLRSGGFSEAARWNRETATGLLSLRHPALPACSTFTIGVHWF